MLNDLKEYTTHADHFKYIRNAQDSIAEAELPNQPNHRASPGTESRASPSSACIPFIGE
jgi:hypothetical protein